MIQVITQRDLIREVAARWDGQYKKPDGTWRYDDHKREVSERLHALDPETATAEDVADIIGNPGWTALHCYACDSEQSIIVRVGQPMDYESSTTDLCIRCAERAYEAIAAAHEVTP